MSFRAMALGAAFALLPTALSSTTDAATPTLGSDAPTLPPRADDPWAARPVAITMTFGTRTPVGTWGGELEWAPTRWTALAVGAGMSPSGTQVSVMPRLFSPIDRTLSFGIGAGVSEGRYVWEGTDALGRATCTTTTCVTGVREWARAIWGNLEFSLEERRAWGLSWRLFGGVRRVLNPADGVCRSDPIACTRDEGTTILFGGVGVGFAL